VVREGQAGSPYAVSAIIGYDVDPDLAVEGIIGWANMKH